MGVADIFSKKKKFVVSFLVPFQDSTAGGVFTIQKIAELIARKKGVAVNLIVQGGELQEVPGVTVVSSKELHVDEIPDADAIVLYPDCPQSEEFASLPASKGVRHIFLQGFGRPGEPVVVENLKRGYPTVATSRWLVEEGKQYGAPTTYIPYGLDASIFFEEKRVKRNPKQVMMLANQINWKGLPDGLAALELVRAEIPDVKIVLFGTSNPGFAADFYFRPQRKKVAELMRSSAVFVCSSIEEGFGLPGWEALICGAALATTDTKGSRDYAMHEKTALVSEPQQPEALAKNIIRLLKDDALRNKLAKAGQKHITSHFPDWNYVAEEFYRHLLAYAKA